MISLMWKNKFNSREKLLFLTSEPLSKDFSSSLKHNLNKEERLRGNNGFNPLISQLNSSYV